MSKLSVKRTNGSTNSGISFAGLLTIVFITLKLTGVINWSWWWVLCPLWAGIAVFIVFIICGLVIAAIAA